MANEKENAIMSAIEFEDADICIDDLEQCLQAEIDEKLEDLHILQDDREMINNPDRLGETILNVVWEQFINQVASTAGEDFIKENGGLTLDLRDEAHIQTSENFAEGKIATHNTSIDYQQRYDDWQANFVKDETGKIVTHTTRSGREEATLVKGARKPFDENRPSGSVANHTDMDHTKSAASIIRDPAANAHMTRDEQISFANSEANLYELDSSLNRSKGDLSTSEWLDTPNARGQKPKEIFDISTDDEKQMRQKEIEANEEYDRKLNQAKQRSVNAGKQSQKEEFYRIGKSALKTAFMTMLATLLKEIIGKLILWLKSADKNISTFTDYVKQAIKSFVGKLKTLLVNTTDSILTTIATSIIGPVIGTIKKTITLLKQGWKSLKEAVQYLRKPENKGKPLSVLLPQVGIIVITGLSGVGAIVLGEFIEKALMGVPFLAVDIPLLGSPANLIGMLMGAIVCGIIGAIAINLINKHVAKQQKTENTNSQIDKQNEILKIQKELLTVKEYKLDVTQTRVASEISARHKEAASQLRGMLESVMDPSIAEQQKTSQEELDALLQGF